MTKGSCTEWLQNLDPRHGVWFVQKLIKDYGVKFVLLLSSIYLLVKGSSYNFALNLELPYYRTAYVDAATAQTQNVISVTPWAFKGFTGVLSDLFPLGGYEKRFYMVIFSVAGASAASALVLLPNELVHSSPAIAAFLLFMVHLQISGQDLLCEGKYIELMKLAKESRGAVVTFVWFIQTLGSLLPAILVGVLSDIIAPRYLFIIVIPLLAQPLIFVYSGCMVNDKVPREKANRLDMEKLKLHSKAITLAIFIAVGSLGTALLALLDNTLVQLIYGLSTGLIMCVLGYYCLPKSISYCNVFILVEEACYVNIVSALDYFYLASPDCVANGPFFSYTYYRTYTSLISVLASLFGVLAFQMTMSNWNIRYIYVVTCLIRIVASFFDYAMSQRWNIQWGISDESMYMFGDAIIGNVIHMMNFLPMSILMAKICPKTIEVTMYAILAGYGNYGQTIGKLVGVFLMKAFNIVTLPTGEKGCNFKNLGNLIIVAHCAIPFIAVPITFLFLPNKRITDEFLEESTFDTEMSETPDERASGSTTSVSNIDVNAAEP